MSESIINFPEALSMHINVIIKSHIVAKIYQFVANTERQSNAIQANEKVHIHFGELEEGVQRGNLPLGKRKK